MHDQAEHEGADDQHGSLLSLEQVGVYAYDASCPKEQEEAGRNGEELDVVSLDECVNRLVNLVAPVS